MSALIERLGLVSRKTHLYEQLEPVGHSRDDDTVLIQVNNFFRRCQSYHNISSLPDAKIQEIVDEVFRALKNLDLNEDNVDKIAETLRVVAKQSRRCTRFLAERLGEVCANPKTTAVDKKLWGILHNFVFWTASRNY